MRVVILAPPMSEVHDITGPFEVFSAANGLASQPLYEIELYSTTNEPRVRTTCGLELPAAGTFRDIRGAIDTLLIAGGSASNDAELLGSILRVSAGARRVGVTTGIDLALELVEEDAGAKVAASVERDLVLYVRRPAGQSQMGTALTLQFADRRALRDLQSWMVENLRADLSVAALASRCAMSPRHFSRVFLRETGTTPARFVERLRVESASRRLEESDDTLDQIATACGFGSADSMRRVFVRVLGHTPSELRTGRKRAFG